MPLPVVRSPLGLPLGDRGLLPLPDALSGVGAGVVAGGPYTLPQRMLDTLTGASSRTGAQGGHSDSCYLHTHTHHIGQLSFEKDNSTGAPLALLCKLCKPGPPGQFPCTAPLLGRGPLTCTLRGPFHLHTWTLAMKTPHWSLLGGAPGPSCSRGRPPMRGPGGAPHGRCQPVRGARAGEGGGGGGQWAGEAARSG